MVVKLHEWQSGCYAVVTGFSGRDVKPIPPVYERQCQYPLFPGKIFCSQSSLFRLCLDVPTVFCQRIAQESWQQ